MQQVLGVLIQQLFAAKFIDTESGLPELFENELGVWFFLDTV